MTAPNGVAVEVSDEAVENLLRRGFVRAEAAKAPAKKAPSKSKK
jgi:hypothetical protein